MSRRLLFDALYRLGRPPWDTPPPDELRHAIEGPDALSPGHVLDVGCGTGTNVIYLGRHGWQVTGVDFSSTAIDKARHKAAGISGVYFMQGDATRLSELPIPRPVDLVLDMGTFHTLSDEGKAAYARELAAVMTPGTPLMMWQGIRIKPGEIPAAFDFAFDIEENKQKDFVIKRGLIRRTISGRWYVLRRKS